jgi:hypothetical protein
MRGSASISLPVTNVQTQEFRLMEFVEKIPNSGLFECSFFLTRKDIPISPHSIPVEAGETVSVTYLDSATTTGIQERIENLIYIVEPPPPIGQPNNPGDDLPEMPPPPDYGEVSFLVNGLFYLNGTFKGKLTIKGTEEQDTRCLILRS